MRYKEIDLTVTKQNTDCANLTVITKSTDNFLAKALESYESSPQDMITLFQKNPLLLSEDEKAKIVRFEDLCFNNQGEIYSLGGVVNSEVYPVLKKRRLVRNYFNRNWNEYLTYISDKQISIKQVEFLLDDYKPKYAKIWLFIGILVIGTLLWFLNFPFAALKNLTFLNINQLFTKMEVLFYNNTYLNIYRYGIVIASIIYLIGLFIYNIVCRRLFVAFKNIMKEQLASFNRIKKSQKRRFMKIKHFLYRQMEHPRANRKTYPFAKFTKYQTPIDINSIEVTVKRLSKQKKFIETIQKTGLIYQIIYGLLLIGYLVYLIIKLVK